MLAWTGTLPLGLRFFADDHAVRRGDVGTAVTSYAVMLAGYLVIAAVARRAFQKR